MTLMLSLATDLRHALRSLRRAPGFATAAVLTLALGIGLATAVFTVADALLLRDLAVRDQDRLVLLWGESPDGRMQNVPFSLTDVREFSRRSRATGEPAFFAFRGSVSIPVRVSDLVFPVQASLVSGNFFDVLGSRATMGRALQRDDDREGAAPVVVLSHRAWQQQFGGNRGVVGRSMTVVATGRAHTIVGVMPPGIEYPRGTDLWVPLVAYSAAGGFLDVVTNELDMLARLEPGATAAQVEGELSAYLARPDAPPQYRGIRGSVNALPDVVLGDTKPALLIVALAAAVLLFITCVNVANLLLVRALGRLREFAVRSALGAGRARLIMQLVAESIVLSAAGGVLGCALAAAAVRAFLLLTPAGMPRVGEVQMNGTALAAAILISTIAMLISGLGPALFTARVNAGDALISGSRVSGGRRMRRAAELLVVAQLALAVTSLSGAALVGRSFDKLRRAELSFEPSRLLVSELSMDQNVITTPAQQRAALDLILSNVASLPGVRGVTPVYAAPFVGAGGGVDAKFLAPGQDAGDIAGNPMVNLEVTASNYFELLAIPVLRGRTFTDADRENAPPVIVISSTVARHYWGESDPVGRTLSAGRRQYTVIGVVPDTRYRELASARPTVYLPLPQSPFAPSTLLIRTSNDPVALIPSLRQAIADAGAGVTLIRAASLEGLLAAPRAEPRLNAVLLALFAGTAVLLAAVGLFAIIATMVRQRTHELGVRMALGATAGDVRRLVMTRGMILAGAGAIIGVALALASSRLLSALLFGIGPNDPLTLVAVPVVMLMIAALATLAPALAGTRIDPVIALRAQS